MIPSHNEFNRWPLSEKVKWIVFETRGKLGDPGVILFKQFDLAIFYNVNGGEVVSARAVSYMEGIEAMASIES